MNESRLFLNSLATTSHGTHHTQASQQHGVAFGLGNRRQIVSCAEGFKFAVAEPELGLLRTVTAMFKTVEVEGVIAGGKIQCNAEKLR